ncbi:hypothetical protein B0H11DRAFT_2255843 [Mycena galericulata]|nr:hypothetical protein B0H11DRAFT_2255843 [Mycena galericulata]
MANQATYTRHPRFWATETRTMVYAVEQTTYRFPLAVLMMMSPPLTAIFNIPQSVTTMDKDGKVQPTEGSEENPIILTGITSTQLDDFLSYFFKSDLAPINIVSLPQARQEEICINLLTVGCLWDIDEAKTYTKGVLVGLDLTPSRTLQIARMFAIHEWVEEAVKRLVPVCGDLTSDDAIALGPTVLNFLFQAKVAIDLERVYVAHTPPKIPGADQLDYGHCANHKICERSLKEGWWNLVGRKVLHPTNPMHLQAIGALLDRTTFPGMNKKCHDDMVDKWTMHWFDEESILDATVKGVTAWHKFYRLS